MVRPLVVLERGLPGTDGDTAPYRYPYYHTVQDTPDKVDYERAARVATGLQRMLGELAGGADAPRQ